MAWSDKSKNVDLFFCTDEDCRVVTFILTRAGNNDCPKCHNPGSFVRSSDLLEKGLPSRTPTQVEE